MKTSKPLFFILILIGLAVSSYATSITPKTWVQLTLDSDFIGILD